MKRDHVAHVPSIAALFLLLSVCPGGTQTCTSPPAGLVGWWRAEGSANDSVGGHHGAIAGGVGFVVGEVAQSFSFNGTDGEVVVANSPELSFGSNQDFSVEAWVQPEASATSFDVMTIADSRDAPDVSHGIGFEIALIGGKLACRISDSLADAGVSFGPAGPDLRDGNFHHVAVTVDRESTNGGRYYVDGIVVREFDPTAESGDLASGQPLRIGVHPTPGFFGNFKGRMDELSIYNRELSTNEVLAVFQAGAGGKCPSNEPPVIFLHPTNVTVLTGADALFSAAASGSPPLSLQWRFNTNTIPGATNSSLVLTGVTTTQAGLYSVEVTNAHGAAISSDALLTVIPPAPCTAAPSGLAGWWRAENSGADAVGGNAGVLSNGTAFTTGTVGHAFRFDGTNDRILVADAPNLNFGSNADFSIEGWIRPQTSPTAYGVMTVVDKRQTSPVRGYELYLQDGRLSCQMATGGYADFQSAGPDLRDGSFHHIAWTMSRLDPAGGRLYVDGVNVLTFNATNYSGSLSNNQPFRLGNHANGTLNTWFKGEMDEISLYNRALSPGEIEQIYAASSGGKCFTPAAPVLTLQPLSQTVNLSNSFSLRVAATGTTPFTYQWRLDGVILAGATNASLTVSNALPSKAGAYGVALTNDAGFAISSSALIKVRIMAAFGNGLPLTNSSHEFVTNVSLSLVNFFTNGLMFYTLDGSTPTFFSPQYTGPLLITQSAILRVLAYSVDFFEAGESDPISILLPPSYRLGLSSGGGGTVGAGPSPGPYYLSNAVVTLTATPDAGWTFLKWLGDASGSSPVTNVTMTRNKSVQALFGTTLNTTAAGGGAVAVNPPGGIYRYGTTVQLSAIPDAGKFFALWGNAASGTVNPLLFTITNANPTVSSLFAALSGGQVALTVVPVGRGTVSVDPRANAYFSGSGVTVTATPEVGQAFLGWSGDATGTLNPLAVTLNTSQVIQANFTARPLLSLRFDQQALIRDGVLLTVLGVNGEAYRLESSSNLVDWSLLEYVTNSLGSVQANDPAATNAPQRFYRALVQ